MKNKSDKVGEEELHNIFAKTIRAIREFETIENFPLEDQETLEMQIKVLMVELINLDSWLTYKDLHILLQE